MATVKVELNNVLGKIKPMHAVNNGPLKGSRMFPERGNFAAYKEAGFPYARNHDAAFCSSYGGEHTVDITAVFPDFDADPYDPASYDFACTDDYSARIMEAGTEVFYRLGQKIDHRVKKYDNKPPKDYKKWAVICEHVIRHYNYGWADGFHFNMTYWEIGNEPGNNGGETFFSPLEEFYKCFEITAKHLKSCFPELKIGGPSFDTGRFDGKSDQFLTYMRDHDVPLDFYSWHLYRPETSEYAKRIIRARELLDSYGFTKAESILNEWNFMRNWKEDMTRSIMELITIKGAAFYTAIMATAQALPLDMLMYYDARPCTLNGLFDSRSQKPFKGYYSFLLFSKLYKLGKHVKTETDDERIYAVAAANEGKEAVLFSYFTNDETATTESVTVKFEGGSADSYAFIVLDNEYNAERICTVAVENGEVTFKMKPNTVVMLEKC